MKTAEHYREKWLECRRHLRAANKGAERNAVALQLAVRRNVSGETHARHMRLLEEKRHETIVWNWLVMPDEDFRLKFGELTAQDLRNMRALLKSMLGNRINRP